MEKNVKVEIELGGVESLFEAMEVARAVYNPSEEEIKKYHNIEDWKEKLGKNGVLVLGKVDGKVVGFILAYKKADEAMHVWNAGVLSEYRQLGIFSNMFEELAVKCKQEGIKRLTLHTVEEKFPEMYKIVINKGFVEFERDWVDDPTGGKEEQSKFELELK